jgi:DNA ligase (NAD+)
MDVEGFGPSIMERFVQLGWIHNLADIYRLDYDKIAELEGFGKKSATKLREGIEKAKKNPIHRLLHSLSIHHMGKKASSLIAERVRYIPDLAKWTETDFTDIPEIGPVVTRNVMAWFANPSNMEVLKQMEALGVNMVQTAEDKPKAIAGNAPLAGKTILFTGSLTQMTREEAEEKAASAGAKNISGVSSKLNILVVGENAGSKLDKAKALGSVEIWTEEEFINKLNG